MQQQQQQQELQRTEDSHKKRSFSQCHLASEISSPTKKIKNDSTVAPSPDITPEMTLWN